MRQTSKRSASPTKTYTKTPLGIDHALDRLWHRGLLLSDRAAHRQALRAIGYYRLLVFMRRFQNPLTKAFRPRTRFTDIVELYDFDRRLRSVTMNALERIEVALRSGLSNPLAIMHGSHWYANQAVYANITGYASALAQIAKECGKRKALGLTHYPIGYGEEWRDALLHTLASCRHVDAEAHLGFPADWSGRPAWAHID